MSKLKSQKQKFWPSIKCWLADVDQQKEPQQHITAVHTWFDAFLLTNDADDPEIRSETLLMRNNLINLFTVLDGFSKEQRQEKLHKYLYA